MKANYTNHLLELQIIKITCHAPECTIAHNEIHVNIYKTG